ncbi:MAG TPA: ATPase domain-containing protein [Alphaproteobacteria bacterium]|nr:ATPase domain-containing protein [Alphaproteobacteria bacterium]
MPEMTLLPTEVPNLDAVLGGGVPAYSLNVIAGQPGTGKTILAQQILFNHVRRHPSAKALYLTTLSEPTVKVVRYMQQFAFFESADFGERVLYQDIGPLVREQSLSEVAEHILRLVDEHRPEVMAIDSFRAIRDLANDTRAFRRFCYDLSVRLASARCTTFLVGEYDHPDIGQGVEFAMADGILYLDLMTQDGEPRRSIQIYKMRGRATEMAPFSFTIGAAGIHVLNPGLILKRQEASADVEEQRLATGIAGLDALLHGGIPRGRSIMLSGVSGTGKTIFAVQFLVSGARQGERGLLFSFEESPDRLRRMAEGFGWDVRGLEAQGLLRLVFVPQSDIRVEEHLDRMVDEVDSFQPQRLVVDSFSVFLHKVKDPAVQREKTFQAAALVQRAGAVGILITDIPAADPYGLSRFGVEETVADGMILLSTEMSGMQRRRYLEVYKMRAVNHVPGRHRMEITPRGVEVFYVTPYEAAEGTPVPPLIFTPLRAMVAEGVRYGSAWLVNGEEGVGKSTLAYQFAIEGIGHQETVLFVSADAPAYQVRWELEQWGGEVKTALQSGRLRILDTHPVAGEAHIDLTDMARFLYDVERQLRGMPSPCRLIMDSLTPIALQYAPHEFVAFTESKNRSLRRPDVALFDTIVPKTLNESVRYSLLNSYDVVVDIYVPDWGEMGQTGQGLRALQVRKARGAKVDTRPYPYITRPGAGVMVQEGFYGGR